jgi:hypothetical protein
MCGKYFAGQFKEQTVSAASTFPYELLLLQLKPPAD